MITKICNVCNTEKPITEFLALKEESNNYRTKGVKSMQYHPHCRPCKAAAAREWRKKHTNYRGTGKLKTIPQEDRLLMSAIGDRLMQAKSRIKKYNQVETNLDREFLYKLFKEQSGRCALSGVELRVEKGAVTCLSLDKIKPESGYLKGNVQWVAWAVNRAKGDMEEAVFFDMCKQITEHQKVQRLS